MPDLFKLLLAVSDNLPFLFELVTEQILQVLPELDHLPWLEAVLLVGTVRVLKGTLVIRKACNAFLSMLLFLLDLVTCELLRM